MCCEQVNRHTWGFNTEFFSGGRQIAIEFKMCLGIVMSEVSCKNFGTKYINKWA